VLTERIRFTGSNNWRTAFTNAPMLAAGEPLSFTAPSVSSTSTET
jgi:hypothetical protein